MRNLQKHNHQHPREPYTLETLLGTLIVTVLVIAIAAEFNPFKDWERKRRDQQNLAELNAITKIFALQSGSPPDRYLTELNTHGFTKSRLLMTPYGGYYQYEPASQKVTNPQAPGMH